MHILISQFYRNSTLSGGNWCGVLYHITKMGTDYKCDLFDCHFFPTTKYHQPWPLGATKFGSTCSEAELSCKPLQFQSEQKFWNEISIFSDESQNTLSYGAGIKSKAHEALSSAFQKYIRLI